MFTLHRKKRALSLFSCINPFALPQRNRAARPCGETTQMAPAIADDEMKRDGSEKTRCSGGGATWPFFFPSARHSLLFLLHLLFLSSVLCHLLSDLFLPLIHAQVLSLLLLNF
ncbi:unnamed protein product [Cuscuta epithymum]|uniref:Uncharacterized protein n=1 Tax=Cuscuta epithymum TaxID=186058 RepID=A0AAV0ELQ3_9ASTE|nr:unnamed protein product [Cuscuta epithymum]